MPQCELVEVRKCDATEVIGWAQTAKDAQRVADEDATKAVKAQFLDWLLAPCPGACPVKLMYGIDYLIGRPRAPVQREQWWAGFADYRYSASMVCLSETACDTIELVLNPGDAHEITNPDQWDFASYPIEVECGLNEIRYPSGQQAGDLTATRREALASAHGEARREANRWISERLAKHSCPDRCRHRIEYPAIRTRTMMLGQFDPPNGKFSAIAEARGSGILYCLGDDEWRSVIEALAERGQLLEPERLLPTRAPRRARKTTARRRK